MDELKQLLLEVSDMFIMFKFSNTSMFWHLCFLIFIIIGWCMQFQAKSSNEEHVMHNTRFTKSSTKENDKNMGFDFQTGIF